jgi:type IX secretion system PorP/SprF family membrane protein
MKRIVFIVIVLLAGLIEIKAQDPLFNQYYNAPLHTNPALTGAFNGKWRAGINYRTNWHLPTDGHPYNTIGASYDMRFKAFNRDVFALGFNMMRDVAGRYDFSITRLHLNGSYLKQLAGYYQDFDSYLAIGFQAGFGQHILGSNNFWFHDQFNATSFTPDMGAPTAGPIGADQSDLYLNANIGLLWYTVFDEQTSIYAGASYFHLNQPDIGIIGDQSVPLDPRYLFHTGGEFPLSESASLLPSVYITQQASFTQILPGFNFRYNSKYFRELALRAGVWARFANSVEGLNNESIIPSIMFEYESWLIGLSYEINLTGITAVNNGRGAFELSVYYVDRDVNFRQAAKCPKF